MEQSQNFEEFEKEIQNYFDNYFNKNTFDEEFNEYILLELSTGKYHVLKNAGGYLRKFGNEGKYFLERLVNKLQQIDRDNNCFNYYGVKTIENYNIY